MAAGVAQASVVASMEVAVVEPPIITKLLERLLRRVVMDLQVEIVTIPGRVVEGEVQVLLEIMVTLAPTAPLVGMEEED